MCNISSLSIEKAVLSNLSESMGAAVLHVMKEVKGHERTEGIGDEEIVVYREYLARVMEALKELLEDSGEGLLEKGGERVIPFSVVMSLDQKWGEKTEEIIGRFDPVVERLKQTDTEMTYEDVTFIKLGFNYQVQQRVND